MIRQVGPGRDPVPSPTPEQLACTHDWVEVMMLGEADPRYLCTRCGWSAHDVYQGEPPRPPRGRPKVAGMRRPVPEFPVTGTVVAVERVEHEDGRIALIPTWSSEPPG